MITLSKYIKNGKRYGKRIVPFSLLLLACSFAASCSDVNTDDMIPEDEYISSDTEMYTGFVGLMTKMQAVGDKEIYLTDTRGEFLEPTENAGEELHNIYNYKDDLRGNSYADPAPYYELVIACNDYLEKLKEYRKTVGVDDSNVSDLISSTVRLKVWAYKTIAEIYGEAAWFDGQIGDVKDFMRSGYETLTAEETFTKCLELLDNGYDGVSSDRVVNWVEWLDPANKTSVPSSSYISWQFMVPPVYILYAELSLWKAAYLDNKGNTAEAQTYYQKAADNCFTALNEYISMKSPYIEYSKSYARLMLHDWSSDPIGSAPYWLPSACTPGKVSSPWYQQKGVFRYECVSATCYDYENRQTNQLVKHFCQDGVAQYLLRPSEVGMANFTDATINPGGDNDPRKNLDIKEGTKGYYMGKYRDDGTKSVRKNAYEDDVTIYTYRAIDYYLLLCEALNNLGRFNAFDCVMNKGFDDSDYMSTMINATENENASPVLKAEWKGFTRNWTTTPEWLTRKYGFAGLRFAYNGNGVQTRATSRVKEDNDKLIIYERIIESCCEGKTYPTMIRMAIRYNKPEIISNIVGPKYRAAGKETEICTKINNGGYWVKYPLQ